MARAGAVSSMLGIVVPTMIALFASSPAQKLMIFGGKNHDAYLGCLNCEPTSPESIVNRGGKYGRCGGLVFDNLFCRGLLSEFGSAGLIASETSACGPSSTNAPVIVDEAGQYYGRFSVGKLMGHNDSVCMSLGRFYNQAACELVEWICEQ